MTSKARLSRRSRPLKRNRGLRRRSAAALSGWLLVAAACTSGSPSTAEPVVTTGAPPVSTGATTTSSAVRETAVDIGVDPENAVIVAAVVQPSAAALAGHRAYWASVNADLGGIGGELGVELFETDTADDAFTGEAAVVSLDEGPVVPVGAIFALAPQQTIEAREAGRILDVTRPTLGQMVSAAAQLAADEAFAGTGELGVAAGASCPYDPMTYQISGGLGSPFVLICGTPDEAAALLAEVDGVVLLTNEAWSPDLSVPEQTYVLGAIPEPGAETPASDVLASVIDSQPWDPAFVRGYTAALTTHLALERAYAAGDLTRSGILEVGRALGTPDVGFGPPGTVTVAVPDESSPTGLRTIDRLVPLG